MTFPRTTAHSSFLWVVAFAIIAVASLLLVRAAYAGEGVLTLSPTNRHVAPGQSFTVEVFVRADTRVNAVEGTVTYPKDLVTATAVSTDGSVMSMWAEQPTINATQGTVRFAGGVTGGVFGSGKVLSIAFQVQKAGLARITLEDSSVLAHDGLGTPVTGVSGSGRYTFEAAAPARVFIEPGDLIKLPDDGNPATNIDTAVYYYGRDGLRYVFPNSKTYFTWYTDFRGVKSVSVAQLGSIGIGGNVTYRPGVKMVKIDSDPKVYAVGKGGSLHWVGTEALAIALYGATWNREIHDVPDSFFTNYHTGSNIAAATDFIAAERAAATPDITADKSLSYPVEVFVNADGSLTPAVVTVRVGKTVRFTNAGTVSQRVKAAAAAAAAGLPGLDSANMAPGLDYAFRMPRAGSFSVVNAANNAKTVTIVAQ